LSFTVRVAERAPVAPGVNVTEIKHVANGLSVPEFLQVLEEVILKSPGFDPDKTMLLMVSGTLVLVLVKVEVLAALVSPTVTEPNFNDDGKSVAVGGDVPVPVNVTT
jgi:hypothetical protein